MSDDAAMKLRTITTINSIVAFSESGYDMDTYLSECLMVAVILLIGYWQGEYHKWKALKR
ncbi:hypothetical protein JCM18900_12341 [Psychrobacter sp. JCM 18900]|nr:hypothetical protein JCM18900_12341 [Psychrobacter sp. JCM 18900]